MRYLVLLALSGCCGIGSPNKCITYDQYQTGMYTWERDYVVVNKEKNQVCIWYNVLPPEPGVQPGGW